MVKQAKKQKNQRVRTGFLTMVLLLLLLAGIGWELIKLQDQVAAAQAERDRLAAQVEAQQQENDHLKALVDAYQENSEAVQAASEATQQEVADAQATINEQIEAIARNELGLVYPGDYLFPDGGN